MRRGSTLLLAACVACLASPGCADEPARRRVRVPAGEAPAAGEERVTPPRGGEGDERVIFDDALAAPVSRSLLLREFETISIAPPTPPAAARPRRRGGRVDIELNGAPFVDTVRMLADVGRFDVVIEAPSASGVQASLHGVDAWDALVAICRAKGVDVRYERGIAIVGSVDRDDRP